MFQRFSMDGQARKKFKFPSYKVEFPHLITGEVMVIGTRKRGRRDIKNRDGYCKIGGTVDNWVKPAVDTILDYVEEFGLSFPMGIINPYKNTQNGGADWIIPFWYYFDVLVFKGLNLDNLRKCPEHEHSHWRVIDNLFITDFPGWRPRVEINLADFQVGSNSPDGSVQAMVDGSGIQVPGSIEHFSVSPDALQNVVTVTIGTTAPVKITGITGPIIITSDGTVTLWP